MCVRSMYGYGSMFLMTASSVVDCLGLLGVPAQEIIRPQDLGTVRLRCVCMSVRIDVEWCVCRVATCADLNAAAGVVYGRGPRVSATTLGRALRRARSWALSAAPEARRPPWVPHPPRHRPAGKGCGDNVREGLGVGVCDCVGDR